jgi:endoglucanase
MKFTKTLSGALLVGAAQAQSGAWGQCGGNGWTGPTSCVSGYHCVYSNDWYSQCLPGSGSGTTPTTTARTTTTAPQTTATSPGNPSATGWKWLGVDESGAEFGQTSLPGTYGKDFIFASTDVLGVWPPSTKSILHY